MSDAERQSPRTAIRNWLQVADSKSTTENADAFPEQQPINLGLRHHSRRHHTTRYSSETKHPHDEEAGRKQQRHNKSGARQKRVTDEILLLNSHQAQPQIHPKPNTASNSNSLGLAERLGLHAPFRTFKDHSDQDIVDVQGRPRKRRRSRSSTSSYLEPAAATDLSENGHDHPSHATILRTTNGGPALGDRGKNTSPMASQSSETMLPSSEKLLKSYERRPRHKTRQDRYELKDNNRHSGKMKQAAKKDREGRKQKKHKRKEKSGAALMHGFAAQNVAHDRLTLKPAKTLGLFGKGRASSPVRRRGLPDLAFSEMTFLTSRREKPKDSLEDRSKRPSNQKKRRISTKAADTEAEISRYFTSAKPTSLDMTSPHGQPFQHDRRRSQDHEPSQAFVDLPDRPFLGFGSCGPNTSVSPAKMPFHTDSRGHYRGDTRSPTRSTSNLTWSQSGGPSYTSPPPKKRHHIEPLASSKLSNRKRAFPAPHEGKHSMPPESPRCVQTTFAGTQGATSKPSSKHEIANEDSGQKNESRLATGERPRSREKSPNHVDNGVFELDAEKIPKDIENSAQDHTPTGEASRHGGPESALPALNQAACQSSGSEPRCEPQAHDVRPSSAQMPIVSLRKDPLDDILDALLRDCNTKVAGSDQISRAMSVHRNSHDGDEARIPDRIEQDPRMLAHTYVSSDYAPEAQVPVSNSSCKPRSTESQQAFAHDGSKSTHTLSRGGLNSSNRPNSGYTSIPTQGQVDSRSAWSGFENLYERQHEKMDLTPDQSKENTTHYAAVKDRVSGLSREKHHSAAPDEYAQDLHPAELGDDYDDYSPYLYKPLNEGNENDNYQEIRHGEWDDQYVDYGASYDAGASILDESHKNFDSGGMAQNHANDYQEKEQSFAQGADQDGIERQLFTTNIPDTYSSWRPHRLVGSNYGLQRCAADTQVQDVGGAFPGFWTPHKLY